MQLALPPLQPFPDLGIAELWSTLPSLLQEITSVSLTNMRLLVGGSEFLGGILPNCLEHDKSCLVISELPQQAHVHECCDAGHDVDSAVSSDSAYLDRSVQGA